MDPINDVWLKVNVRQFMQEKDMGHFIASFFEVQKERRWGCCNQDENVNRIGTGKVVPQE